MYHSYHLGAGHRMRSHSLTSGHSSLPSLSTQNNQNPHKLEVGSAIQYGDPPQYGVIKWIGVLPNYKEVMYAGLDMVSCYTVSSLLILYASTIVICVSIIH